MEIIGVVASIVGVAVATLGLAGGLLSLPAQIREFLIRRRSPGDRGATWLVLSREAKPTGILVRFLIVGDLVHILSPVLRVRGARFESVALVGEYYEASVHFPPGTDLRHRIVDKPR